MGKEIKRLEERSKESLRKNLNFGVYSGNFENIQEEINFLMFNGYLTQLEEKGKEKFYVVSVAGRNYAFED